MKDAAFWRAYRAKERAHRTDVAGTRRTKLPVFIAWDGEGYTTEFGEHRYFLLANSLGEHIIDENGLSTEACFEFLLSTAKKHPNAVHVCYGASYDANMMLRDCDWDVLDRLWHGKGDRPNSDYVHWGEYGIVYHQRKKLALYDWYRKRSVARSVVLWDVIGFFQVPFVTAIKEHLGDDYADLRLIATNKAKRSQFDIADRDEILDYCQKELRALVLIMDKFAGYLEQAEIHLTSWHGSGAIGTALLQRHGVKAHKAQTKAQKYAAHAYAGGRIELIKFGTHRHTVFNYDINSAYPAAMLQLPSLRDGTWIRNTNNRRTVFSLSRVRWKFTVDYRQYVSFYPFFYRLNDGSIYYPSEGEGWYWEPEVKAAIDTITTYATRPDDFIEVLETWNFEPATDDKPFAFIEEMYALRQQWKGDGIAAQYALKLGLNSLYGKVMQQIGGKNGKEPPFHQLEWAGYITSYTRAQLLRAACQHPQSVIMLATDGIYTTEELELQLSKKLGEWQRKEYDGLVTVQSGVYWLQDENRCIAYCRGFDRDTLNVAVIQSLWRYGYDSFESKTTRFLTLGSAVSNPNLRSIWRTWPTTARELSLLPDGKRTLWKRGHPHRNLVPTLPTIPLLLHLSAPFKLKFQMSQADMEERIEFVDGVDSLTILDEVDIMNE